MGLREKVNENRWIAIGAVTFIFALSTYLIVRQFAPSRDEAKVFFSADGVRWHADSIRKIPPFNEGGQILYRARVFRCGDGAPFINHLEAFPDDVTPTLQEAVNKHRLMGEVSTDLKLASDSLMVKKPAINQWVQRTPKTAVEFDKIVTPVCPGGSKDVVEVVP